jgi:hypothetical protein
MAESSEEIDSKGLPYGSSMWILNERYENQGKDPHVKDEDPLIQVYRSP